MKGSRPLLHWPRGVPALAVLLLGVGFIVWLAATGERYNVGSGGSVPALLEPAFTRADLERIAAGGPADPSRAGESVLVGALLRAASDRTPEYPGRRAVEVGFAPATGERIDVRRFGWPTPWIIRYEYRNYENGATRAGFVPASTDHAAAPLPKYENPRDPLRIPVRKRWEWYGDALAHQPPPEETGGVRVTTHYRVFGLAAPLAVLILAWLGAGAAVWLANRFRARERRWRGRGFRVAATVGAALLMLAAVLGSGEWESAPQRHFPALNQANFPPAPVFWTRAGYTRLPLMRDEIEGLASVADGDRRLAEFVLSAVAGGGSGGEEYLAAVVDAETQLDVTTSAAAYTNTLLLLYLQRQFFVRRPDFGTPELVAPSWRVRSAPEMRMHGYVAAGIGSADASRPSYVVALHPEIAGAVALAMFAVYLMLRGVCAVLWRRVQGKRRGAGQCPACGYGIAGAAAAGS